MTNNWLANNIQNWSGLTQGVKYCMPPPVHLCTVMFAAMSFHCDLDHWPFDAKLQSVQLCCTRYRWCKFGENVSNTLQDIVHTLGRTDARTHAEHDKNTATTLGGGIKICTVEKNLHGQDVKYHRSTEHVSDSLPDNTRRGPLLPPSKQEPRPVWLPSSHQPHDGLCWHFLQYLRSTHLVTAHSNKRDTFIHKWQQSDLWDSHFIIIIIMKIVQEIQKGIHRTK